jgi:hypothetical protein
MYQAEMFLPKSKIVHQKELMDFRDSCESKFGKFHFMNQKASALAV